MMIYCFLIHYIYDDLHFFLYENVMKELYHENIENLCSCLDFPSYKILIDVLLIYLFPSIVIFLQLWLKLFIPMSFLSVLFPSNIYIASSWMLWEFISMVPSKSFIYRLLTSSHHRRVISIPPLRSHFRLGCFYWSCLDFGSRSSSYRIFSISLLSSRLLFIFFFMPPNFSRMSF